MSRAKVRAALVAAIERDVRWLLANKKRDDLYGLTEAAGWIWNYRSMPPARQLAKTLIALAPVLPQDHLEALAHGAAFNRARARGFGWDRADDFADDVLRDAGVDMRAYHGQFDPEQWPREAAKLRALVAPPGANKAAVSLQMLKEAA